MIIYKVVKCRKCGKTFTIGFNIELKTYEGVCKKCRNMVVLNEIGDESLLERSLGIK